MQHPHQLLKHSSIAPLFVVPIDPTFRTSNWHIEYFNEAIGFPEVADRALSQ
jgi:hypothetical protein